MELSCLLDRKRLVCDFASAVVNKSQLQTAKCWRADFIFDPSDLHKLLVLGNIHWQIWKTFTTKYNSFSLERQKLPTFKWQITGFFVSKISTYVVSPWCLVFFVTSVKICRLCSTSLEFCIFLLPGHLIIFLFVLVLPAAPFSSRAVCLSWWGTSHSGSLPRRRPRVPAESRSPDGHREILESSIMMPC